MEDQKGPKERRRGEDEDLTPRFGRKGQKSNQCKETCLCQAEYSKVRMSSKVRGLETRKGYSIIMSDRRSDNPLCMRD